MKMYIKFSKCIYKIVLKFCKNIHKLHTVKKINI